MRLFESLETRQLLSVTLPHARKTPAAKAYPIADVVQPMGGATPYSSSYTPSQVCKAYGFDQISLPGVTGDGSGQTIAIVDAYDNPSIVGTNDAGYFNSDLHKFNVQFNLPDPPSFVKVNQTGGSTMPTFDAG